MYLPFRSSSSCLGADDTIGVFLMRDMIGAGVAGRYVFHVGEEIGGIGSSWLASHHRDWLATFRSAIAFDRAGRQDVITCQGGRRTCSDRFAQALALALNRQGAGFNYAPCDRGVYTDTAEYAGIIGECTNLSVGYARQHTPAEYVDMRHVLALRRALRSIDWLALPCERDACDDDRDACPYGGGSLARRDTSVAFLDADYAALVKYEAELAEYERSGLWRDDDDRAGDDDRVWHDDRGYTWRRYQ